MDVSPPFDPIKRPATPVKTSWFEFLLDASLLEEHLKKDYPDPSAADLIALFLYQADVAASTAREIKDDAEQALSGLTENKKIRALKLLALKVAAFLNWNLDTLNKSVPLAMVQDILLELLKITLTDEDADPAKHQALNYEALPEPSLFAVQLYHRWCMKVILEDSFPSKPSKTQAVQVPGLEIPVLNAANGKETVMTIVREGLTTSINVLKNCLSAGREILMPTIQSLGFLNHESTMVTLSWEYGVQVPAAEILAQISYDLGSMSFHMQKYEEAFVFFRQTKEIISKISSSIYCSIDQQKLHGYSLACQSMCGQIQELHTLYDRVEYSKKSNCKEIVDLLLEDNQCRELSIEYRNTIEEFVMTQPSLGSVPQEVSLCNSVRKAIEGKTMSPQCERLLNNSKHNIRFTMRCINITRHNLSHSQAINLKTFLRYLCYKLPNETRFVNNILDPPLRSLFTEDDIQELTLLVDQSTDQGLMSVQEPIGTEPSELERQLLTTYEASVIKDLVQKLLTKTSKTKIMFLSDQWRIPRELSHPIEGLPIPWVQVYSHILVAKARICLKLQLYDRAKALLQAADNTVKDISYKLAKVLRWELLRLDLLQHQSTGGLSPGTTKPDVIKRAKACIVSSHEVKKDKDLQPSTEVVSSAVAFLFNSKEWEYLTSLTNITNGYVQICRLLVNVSTNFQLTNMAGNYSQISTSRKSARDLWEAVTQIFTSSTQQKRTGTGSVTNVQRDNNGILPMLSFINFIKKLKDHTTISALLSCLMKLYTMLKSEVNTEIYIEYAALWPSALPNVSSIMTNAVTDAVNTTLQHARSLDVVQPSWLRTQADYCFANGEYTHALKHYLELGVLLTDYFSDLASRNVYDESIIKCMIKCCSMLQCHTQVAVLCQCLDDIDYATAFKALQENNNEDAMDTYYPYIWDSTMLEYIINLHHKRGYNAKKQSAIKAIGQYEVNCSNPPEILFEAAKVRKANFFRTMVKQYL